MTAPTTPDIEHLRHADSALREALGRREAGLPMLSPDFTDKTLARLNHNQHPINTEDQRPTRRLWPYWAAAAAVLVAVLLLPALWHPTATRSSLSLPLSSDVPAIAVITKPVRTTSVQTQAHRTGSLQHVTVTQEEAPTMEATLVTQAPDTTTSEPSKTVTDSASLFRLDDASTEALLACYDAKTVKSNKNTLSASVHRSAKAVELAVNFSTNLASYGQNSIEVIHGLQNQINIENTSPNLPSHQGSDASIVVGDTGSGGNSGNKGDKGDAGDKDNNDGEHGDNDGADNSTTRAATPASSSATDSKEYHQYSSHNLPLSFGLSLRVPITSYFGIETGLTYTYLQSEIHIWHDNEVIDNAYTQRIHYLGIPIHAMLRIIQHRRWQAYATAGTTIDIPIYGSQSGHGEQRRIHAPIQFSADIGLGLQYDFNSRFGIFVQPSMQWFIPMGSDVETYRTEHPLHFTLPVGLRVTL